MNLTHSDERRDLYSFPEAKLIIANQDTVIGKHYHKIKEETFILSSGECRLVTAIISTYGGLAVKELDILMEIGKIYMLLPYTYHEFHLTKGSILIGLNSRPYDSTDDYRI